LKLTVMLTVMLTVVLMARRTSLWQE